MKGKRRQRSNVFLVLGPWHHGQEIEEVTQLGPVKFRQRYGLYFREEILAPFLAHYLKDSSPAMEVAPVTAFETGANKWERLETWPSACDGRCTPKATPLYLEAGDKLGFAKPEGGDAFDEYVSDPAKPVPYRARPSQPIGYTPDSSWVRWLVDDQREFSGTAGCADVHERCADEAADVERRADGESGGVDERDGCGLGGEVDRCVSG